MGAINYAGRSISIAPVVTPRTQSADSVSAATTSSAGHSFRWSVFIAGLGLLVFLMLGVELAVYELVDAGSKLADKLYRHAVVAYEEFEPAAPEADAPTIPQDEPSTRHGAAGKNEAGSRNQHLAKDHLSMHCMLSPHGCN